MMTITTNTTYLCEEFVSTIAVGINDSNKDDYICIKCCGVLLRPYELHCCGRLMCEKCISDTENNTEFCPRCNLESQVHYSKRSESRVCQLPAKCPFTPCKETGSLHTILNNHISECVYDFIVCCFCKKSVLRKHQDEHEQVCVHRKCPYHYCTGCIFTGNKTEINHHINDYKYHFTMAADYVDKLKQVQESTESSLKSGLSNMIHENQSLREKVQEYALRLDRVGRQLLAAEKKIEEYQNKTNNKKNNDA